MNAFLDGPAPAHTQSAHAEELLRRQPDYVPALMVNALAKERTSDFAAARDIYERILKQMPFFTPANRKLALLYFQPLPDPQKAYAHATKAREAFPRDAQVARTLGILEYQRGEFSRAAQLLAESSQTLQTDAEVIYYLGAARYKLKQPKESKEHLTKALAMAPNSAFAIEAKRLLRELQ
jgi:tetratricopeptide (TPR) repeat protein